MFLLVFCFPCLPVRADDWSLNDKDGVRYTLSGLHGKWVIVNFWAPWCSPCIQEIPELIFLQKQHPNLQIIGVAVMFKSKQEVFDIVNKKNINYPIILGKDEVVAAFGGVESMPTSLIYSPDGKLVGSSEGVLTRVEVENFIGHK
jgi:thiol-disulfide isomerase/thioredoxin